MNEPKPSTNLSKVPKPPPTDTAAYLDVLLEVRINGERINSLFHVLIKVYCRWWLQSFFHLPPLPEEDEPILTTVKNCSKGLEKPPNRNGIYWGYNLQPIDPFNHFFFSHYFQPSRDIHPSARSRKHLQVCNHNTASSASATWIKWDCIITSHIIGIPFKQPVFYERYLGFIGISIYNRWFGKYPTNC